MLFFLKRRMNVLALIVGLLFCVSGFCQDTLAIPEKIPFAEGLEVRQSIKDECQLGEKMSSYLATYIGNTKATSEKPDHGKYLELSITGLHAIAGGLWSGSKWMEVQGTLFENGEPKASFSAKRSGGKNHWGACGAAQKCAKAISKEIANWIKKPVDGARLGDAP